MPLLFIRRNSSSVFSSLFRVLTTTAPVQQNKVADYLGQGTSNLHRQGVQTHYLLRRRKVSSSPNWWNKKKHVSINSKIAKPQISHHLKKQKLISHTTNSA
jgi:hypothetical protein